MAIMAKRDKRIIAVFAVLAVLIAGTFLVVRMRKEERCGIENCHGYVIECGPDVAEMCAAFYQAGDRCREHATCETIDSRCQVRTTPEYDECVECVQECLERYKGDPQEALECESRC